MPTNTSKIANRSSRIVCIGVRWNLLGQVGGWRQGRITHFLPHAEYLRNRGMVSILADYRVLNRHGTDARIALSDAKSAIRYFRKDFDNGDTYAIDPSTIFAGGYSAGAVIAVHLSYIDSISDLPTTPINVQAIINNVSPIHGLEGDAGNYGYSSDVNGVISFAGGINDINWIDPTDEPLVSIQGTSDLTVNYNCGPGMNNPAILTLCGSGEMHPRADNVGVLNDKLIFNGTDHNWTAFGNTNSKFIDAVNFTTNFLYPLLPCNNTTAINEMFFEKQLIQIIDILGRETVQQKNTPQF